MRIRAPEGKSHPTVRGIVIEPKDDLYEVDVADGKMLIESHGYIDAEASPAKPAAADKGDAKKSK